MFCVCVLPFDVVVYDCSCMLYDLCVWLAILLLSPFPDIFYDCVWPLCFALYVMLYDCDWHLSTNVYDCGCAFLLCVLPIV